MRIVFCGTPEFSVPTLGRLVSEKMDVALVLTNPDEPRGRGYALEPSPVKRAALGAGLTVLEPLRLSEPEIRSRTEQAQPDAIVVVAYGHLIPGWMIALPPLGCINLHASLLPRYRGAAPIAWAIMRGEQTTGNTTMLIDSGLDTGGILLRQEISILENDTAATLAARLSRLGADLMVETLRHLAKGLIQPQPQDPQLATFAPKLTKADGVINWTMPSNEIAWRVRGLQPWPVAHTTFRGKGLQVRAARPFQAIAALPPGVLRIDSGRLITGCGAGTALELLDVQLEGRKRIRGEDFANGVRLAPGERLGV